MKEIRFRWVMIALVTLIGFALDWYTKFLADTKLVYGKAVNVIGENLEWLLVYNKGAIFGLNPQNVIDNFPTNQFFFVFSIIAIILLLLYYRSIPKKEKIMHWGIALILPGAIGNLFDRIIHAEKGVIDFIKVGISRDIYWPIFNLADVYVTVGVGLLIFAFILEEINNKKRKESVQTPVS
jgi:signal peptidase II